jgi:hypothetical protein
MPIDDLNGIGVCDRDMVWLYANNFSIFLVYRINGFVSFPLPTLPHQPKISELSWERCWYAKKCLVPDIRKKEVEDWKGEEQPW